MNSEDGQVYCVYILQFSCFTKYNRIQSKHKQTNIADETLTDYSFLSMYHYTKSKNYLKDDIEFVTEFPCLLGHSLQYILAYIYTFHRINVITNCDFLITNYPKRFLKI